LPWVDDFNEDTPLSHRQLALACREAGIPCPASLAMDSPLCEEWENKYGDEYPWVNAMRVFRRTNMLLSRFYAVRSRVRKSDNRFPYGMKYFGAVPGRWSGDAGFNVQNMPRGELFGVNLRSCFQPSDGCVFVIADLSQIEPRILAWLIDDHEFLSLVRDGVDIYEAHARATMGYNDPAPLEETNSTLRGLAKARVLGLGYGCGPKKFVSVAKNLGGIEISFAEAKQTVADFRSKNPKISRLWKFLCMVSKVWKTLGFKSFFFRAFSSYLKSSLNRNCPCGTISEGSLTRGWSKAKAASAFSFTATPAFSNSF